MNDFPEMPKRGIELPLGCKDLIDLDAVRNWRRLDRSHWPKRELDQLAYVEGYLASLLELAGKAALVCVGRSQNGGMVMVRPAPDLAGSAIFAKWNSPTEEQGLRAVFDEAGISPLAEPVGRYKAKRMLKYPLPAEPSAAARFIGGVLRAGYGLDDMAPVSLFHHELKAA